MKPNIIFYFSDQQRYDTVTPEIMPNLTKLAKEGVKYDNSFTCQPVCGPARACLQSGVYATQNKATVNGISLTREIKPLASYFNDAGYQTAYIGKWHLATDRLGANYETKAIPRERQGEYQYVRMADVLEFTSHGYDGFVFDENGNKIDFKGYRADKINDFALEYLDKRDKDKPFFMFVSQLEPHHQNDHHSFECPKGYDEEFKNEPIPDDLNFLPGNYNKHYANYLGCIKALDENLGRLVEKLKDLGIWDNTILIYTSDHSCHFATRNAEYKRSCHDSSIHTPLVICGDGFKGGKIEKKLVSIIDLPPTLLDMAGIPIPSSYEGKSLLGNEERDFCFVQISESKIARAIRTKRYTYSIKGVGNPLGSKNASTIYFEDYLYDNEKDPNQKNNLIKDVNYKEIKLKLRGKLVSEMIRIGEAKPRILSCVFPSKK